MGPYCKYCNTRCFTHFPQWTPQHVIEAYRPGVTIIATCQTGQAVEKASTGYCWANIQAMKTDAPVEDFIKRVMGPSTYEFLCDLRTITLEQIHWEITADVEGCEHEGDLAFARRWQQVIRSILAGRYDATDAAMLETAVAPI